MRKDIVDIRKVLKDEKCFSSIFVIIDMKEFFSRRAVVVVGGSSKEVVGMCAEQIIYLYNPDNFTERY